MAAGASAMTATLTTALAVYKENYTGSRLHYATYQDRPFLGAVPKKTGFGGKYKPIPIQYATVGGRSKTYTNSRSGIAAAQYEAFDLTRAKDYQQFRLDVEAMMAAQGDSNAFTNKLKAEGDSALSNISESISRGLFGNLGGSVGVIGSGQGTPTLTLSNISDIVNFQVGDTVVSAATDGTSGVVSANSATLTAVDRNLGTITAGANFHVDFDDGDYLFHIGDFGNSFAGLAAWLPSAAPGGGDSFFGVNRSVDPQWLAGVRYTAASAVDSTIDGALVNAGARVQIAGGRTDLVVMNPIDVATLAREAMGKTSFDKSVPMRTAEGKMGAKFGYSSLSIALGSGDAKVLGDKHCPLGVAYMLDMRTWCFHSLGTAPFMFREDGTSMLRETDQDAVTGRFQVYGNLACTAPGRSARVDITDVN